MKESIPELQFTDRSEFRRWLAENGQESGGVWLAFDKTKTIKTLTAGEALEEALCFGWIDGQMRSIDSTRYLKYFAPRRKQSVWSVKNKQLVQELCKRGLITEYGEAVVAAAQSSGTWDAPGREPITAEQIAELGDRIVGKEPAYTNFQNMPPSVRRTYTAMYLAPKSPETREKTLLRIMDRLNQNKKPM